MRKVATILISQGKSQEISGPGKFLRILSSTGGALVGIASDDGQNNNAVPGVEIAFKASVKKATLSCPGAIADVTVQYYIGDAPYVGKPQIESGQTITTTDWISLGVLVAVKLAGTLVLSGTTYRRQSITVTNLNGLSNFSANATTAQISGRSAKSAITDVAGVHGWNTGASPLLPAAGANGPVYPVKMDTSDDIFITVNALQPGGADIEIDQTWVPVLTQ